MWSLTCVPRQIMCLNLFQVKSFLKSGEEVSQIKNGKSRREWRSHQWGKPERIFKMKQLNCKTYFAFISGKKKQLITLAHMGQLLNEQQFCGDNCFIEQIRWIFVSVNN